MNRLVKCLAGIVLASNAGLAVAESIGPYIGADFIHTWLRGRNDFRFIQERTYPGGSLYAGWKFGCGNFSYAPEIGYEVTKKERRTHVFSGTQYFLGVTEAAGNSIQNYLRLEGFYLDLVGGYALAEWLEGIASIGLASKRLAYTTFHTPAGLAPLQNSLGAQHHTKTIFRFGAGLKAMVNRYFGVRAMARFENTKNLKATMNNSLNTTYIVRASKNAFSLSLGGFLTY